MEVYVILRRIARERLATAVCLALLSDEVNKVVLRCHYHISYCHVLIDSDERIERLATAVAWREQEEYVKLHDTLLVRPVVGVGVVRQAALLAQMRQRRIIRPRVGQCAELMRRLCPACRVA